MTNRHGSNKRPRTPCHALVLAFFTMLLPVQVIDVVGLELSRLTDGKKDPDSAQFHFLLPSSTTAPTSTIICYYCTPRRWPG